jgi:hypothetical protein
MRQIAQETVEATWQDVARLTPERAGTEISRVAKSQPYILPFVLASAQGCRPEAQELAVYLCYVVLRIFERATGRRMPPVAASQIERRWTRNDQPPARAERLAAHQAKASGLGAISAQPFVVGALVDALMEQGEETPALTEDERATLLVTLTTVIDVLDEAGSALEAT